MVFLINKIVLECVIPDGNPGHMNEWYQCSSLPIPKITDLAWNFYYDCRPWVKNYIHVSIQVLQIWLSWGF